MEDKETSLKPMCSFGKEWKLKKNSFIQCAVPFIIRSNKHALDLSHEMCPHITQNPSLSESPLCGGDWQRACRQRSTSLSESRLGSRSASWLGSWFELCGFTSIAIAVPITNRICALRGDSLFLLRWLTRAWLHRAIPKCTHTNHVPKELCVHKSSESGFLGGSWYKTPFFCSSKAWFERALWTQRVKSGFQIRRGSESQSETAESFLCEQALYFIAHERNSLKSPASICSVLKWFLTCRASRPHCELSMSSENTKSSMHPSLLVIVSVHSSL